MKSKIPKGKQKPREYEQVDAGKLLARVAEIAKTQYRLCTITGVDTGESIEMLYHFELPEKLLTLRVPLDRKFPKVQTITGVMPSAVLYERETHEMLGVDVIGHPRKVNTIISDEYVGPPPLRKPDK